MEHEKLFSEWKKYSNLLKKMEHCQWPIKRNYDIINEVIYNIEVLKSNLCDYKDAYISVKDDIVTTAHTIPTQVTLQNCPLK